MLPFNSSSKTSVLFVCTGNIFRSMIAEHAFRKLAGNRHVVASAGTQVDFSRALHPFVVEEARKLGLDVRAHKPQPLSASLISRFDVVICMAFDHQKFIFKNFGRHALLFNKAAFQQSRPALDETALPANTSLKSKEKFVRGAVHDVHDAMPSLMKNLKGYCRHSAAAEKVPMPKKSMG